MQFTEEQEAILAAGGDLKINAVAGSGKTSVLVEYAKRRKSGSRLLYLAFNRSVRMEAQRRFAEEQVAGVDVQTAHSLAFRHIAIPNRYTISKGYRIHELVPMLGIQPGGLAGRLRGDPQASFIIASHILRFAALFCNSAKTRVQDLDYRSVVADEDARKTVHHHYQAIEQGTRLFLAKMDRKEIDATHDFYLKKFQLARPSLCYDTILFDEGQDASQVMLDVFMAQRAQKIIVGDRYQQIYGWRQAVNALEAIDFPTFRLSASFRFNDHIAALAQECLAWKRLLGESPDVRIEGLGRNKKIRTRATIARTNLALLKGAIDTVLHDRSIKKLYFEGNLNSYTYAADGASIYDVLNLSLGKRDRIRDPLIASLHTYEELEDYAEKSEDIELKMLIDIVDTYGKEIPSLLRRITAMHVGDEERGKADMIFSTLHRCKGMEYDQVTLAEDFITGERIRRLLLREKEVPVDRAKLSEEINLVYVGVTRSRNFIDFPDAMFPAADRSLYEKKAASAPTRKGFPKLKDRKEAGAHLSAKRRDHANAYKPWDREQDAELAAMFQKGVSPKELARSFGRNLGAIAARLRKLGLEE